MSRMDIVAGNGDRCMVLPRDLPLALDADPEQLRQRLFVRVFSD